MAIGYWIVKGDKTSCGGTVLNGRPEKQIGKNLCFVAVNGSPVSCGKHPGTYMIAGGHPGDIIHNSFAASTLYSRSTCPCQARFIPSQTFMMHAPYEEEAPQRAATTQAEAEPAQFAQTAKKPSLPPYLTGEKPPSEFVPDYPVLRNTLDFPDENLRRMLAQNSHEVMLLTLTEAFEVLQSWGSWEGAKTLWVETTQSDGVQVMINYGLNGKDVVTTSMTIARLGSFGIKATVYINHKGTELIKITGYPGIRKVLNAPVFALKNPKVIELAIGKYGLNNSVIKGGIYTFFVAAAYRVIDFVMNDATSLSVFIGSIATDVAKIGIASALSWGLGTLTAAYFPFVVAPLIVVVGVGLLVAVGLNKLDKNFAITDKVIAYIEAAQQEVMRKALEIEKGVWDLGSMYADRMLEKGKEVIEYEVKKYLRKTINEVIKREY